MDTLVSGHGHIDLTRQRRFTLGRLAIDPSAHEITRDGQSEHIQPQPLKVLVALAHRRGQVVTRDELVERCWDGRIVGDDVLNRAILLLRGLAAKTGDFTIETVPKAGYRLVENAGSPSASRHRVTAVAIGTALLIVTLLAWSPWSATSVKPAPPVIELAALTASGEPGTKAAAGAIEAALATMLTNSGLPVKEAGNGNAGSADLRLTGRVRQIGTAIEATIQVDDVRHRFVLLSRQFRVPVTKAATLPDQVGAFAATSLAATSAIMVLDERQPGDARMTGELLRQLSMTFTFEDALGTYQAVERIAAQMPDSAIAQLGLAMNSVHALPLLPMAERGPALQRARAAAARAQALAPRFGDVYWTECRLYSPARFAACEAAMRKAFAQDPGAPFTAAELRNLLVNVGRFAEARSYDRLAVAAMPYMAGRLSRSSALLGLLGEREAARATFQRADLYWPDHPLPARDLVEGMVDRGDLAGAAAFVATRPGVAGIDRPAFTAIAQDAAAGDRAGLRAQCAAPAAGTMQACVVALGAAGDRDAAYALLDRAFPRLVAGDPAEEDRRFLAYRPILALGLLSAPALAPLRDDPRYLAIAGRVGLLRYWRGGHWPDFCTRQREPVCARMAGG